MYTILGKCSRFFSVFLGFFNYDIIFKIINILKVNNNNFKFNSNFKNYITVKKKGKYKITSWVNPSKFLNA